MGEVCSETLIVAYPDESVHDAMVKLLGTNTSVPIAGMSAVEAPHVLSLSYLGARQK